MNLPENFELDELTALARLDIEQGRVEQGLSKLKAILVQEPPPPEAVSMAARLYAQLRLFDRALPLFERYLSMRPGAVDETFQLGMVLLDKGDSQRALEIWEEQLRQQPTFPPGLFYCAVVLSRQGKIAEAKRNLDVLLQTAPADNLYYERSQGLLQAIEGGAVQASASPAYQA